MAGLSPDDVKYLNTWNGCLEGTLKYMGAGALIGFSAILFTRRPGILKLTTIFGGGIGLGYGAHTCQDTFQAHYRVKVERVEKILEEGD
eukprot:CAMPEP_0201486524 /NCGR_PEP_ID=MMETSP0151_2-20130828/10588_1 /ASSEMBLY_ACC=CAM_ASM_000257 /TAXON_ID=200890 /ORGANISM="Paramoeba atlantica, Strain 621/1 / CCAP 1560/9" /LENGTH=88 /DNA_ID=CAMNT_0047871213 /DNA_START=25 /DNA_END=291 /DNA_ORIENTATION=-